MKKVHTDEQIVGIMRGYEGSGVTVKEYCRTKGIHETTYYAWKKRFGTMEVGEVRGSLVTNLTGVCNSSHAIESVVNKLRPNSTCVVTVCE